MMDQMAWECAAFQQITQAPVELKNPAEERNAKRKNLTARVNAFVATNYPQVDQAKPPYGIVWDQIKHDKNPLTSYSVAQLDEAHRKLDALIRWA
jgi:hypothetical protein